MADHVRPAIDPRFLQLCRDMRTNATNAEALLWKLLRNRQLGGRKFRRQNPVGGFILDFYCHEAQVGIELDGGGHADTRQAEYDAQRTRILARNGIRVLRFWNNQVMEETEAVVMVIWDAVQVSLQG